MEENIKTKNTKTPDLNREDENLKIKQSNKMKLVLENLLRQDSLLYWLKK